MTDIYFIQHAKPAEVGMRCAWGIHPGQHVRLQRRAYFECTSVYPPLT